MKVGNQLLINYRLTSLGEFLGNQHIVNYLKNTYDYTKHLLFEGERGTGKTTFAYIVAKQFVDSEENIHDINCQHYSGVNEMRSLVENYMNKTSLFGNKKVVILDEVHSLSKHAERELLKPLEDEKYIGKILLIGCTTSVNTLSKMFLDRFTRLKTNPLSTKQSLELISQIEQKENFKLGKNKKVLIIEKSEGNPRLIINNILKIQNIENEEEIKAILTLSSIDTDEEILKLFKVINSNSVSWKGIVNTLNKALKRSSPQDIRIGLINILAGKLKSQYLPSREEGNRLLQLYTFLSKDWFDITDKASLIIQLYRYYQENPTAEMNSTKI